MHRNEELPALLPQVVKAGKVYELGHILEPGIPHFPSHPPFLFALMRQHGDMPSRKSTVTASNDVFTTGGHTGTHIDAIGHVGSGGCMHGSVPIAGNQSKSAGLLACGIEGTAPVFQRGVLLDVAGYQGVANLPAGYAIKGEELAEVARKQGVTVRPGDAVLIRTGWSRFWDDHMQFLSLLEGTPGPDLDGAQWIVDQGATLTGSDTFAYEVVPNHHTPVHALLLVEQGIQIMEMLAMDELAAHAVYEFLFVCLPLRIQGGTGSPIRPVAVC